MVRKMGLNIGNDQNATVPNTAPYNKVQNAADLAYLRPYMDRLRIALTYGADTNDLNNLKQLAIDAKAAGFYVMFGITAGMDATTATYYNRWLTTDVVATAKWCQANHIDEFMIGNEEDWHAQNEGSLKPKTPQQIRNDVRGLVPRVRAVYSGLITYCTAEGTLQSWTSEGIGALDVIYFNVYDTTGTFTVLCDQIANQWPGHCGISEWASGNPYPNGMTDSQYASDIATRAQVLENLNIPAYLYTWRDDGTWAFKLSDGTTRPGFFGVFSSTPPPPTTLTGTFSGTFTGTFTPN